MKKIIARTILIGIAVTMLLLLFLIPYYDDGLHGLLVVIGIIIAVILLIVGFSWCMDNAFKD